MEFDNWVETATNRFKFQIISSLWESMSISLTGVDCNTDIKGTCNRQALPQNQIFKVSNLLTLELATC